MNTHTIRLTAAALGLAGLATFGTAIAASAATPAPAPAVATTTGAHGPGDPGLAGRPASAGGPILSVAQADQELGGEQRTGTWPNPGPGDPGLTGRHGDTGTWPNPGPGDPGLTGRQANAGGTVVAEVQWTQVTQVILADLGQGIW